MQRTAEGKTLRTPARSSSAAFGRRERRSAQRVFTLLRVAKLTTATGEMLAIVRNISEHGMMLETAPNVPVERRVVIDLGLDRRFEGKVAWRNGASLGVHFDQSIDVSTVLEKRQLDPNGKVVRLPRVAVSHQGELYHNEGRHTCEVRDISLGGARVDSDLSLCPGARVCLSLQLLGKIEGVVRWSRGGSMGISFNKAVPVHSLMAWLAMAPAPESDAWGVCQPVQSSGEEGFGQLAASSMEAIYRTAIVCVTDGLGKIVEANSQFCETLGYPRKELIGTASYAINLSLRNTILHEQILRDLAGTGLWHGELCYRRKDGGVVWTDATIFTDPGATPGVKLYTTVHYDISPQKTVERDLWKATNLDPITALPNRRSFLEHLEATLGAVTNGSELIVGIVDLDGFKDFNDAAGHDSGDRLLAAVAKRLRAAAGETDVVARLSGDEFAFALSGLRDRKQGEGRLERISSALRCPYREAGCRPVSVSLGLVHVRAAGASAQDVVNRADIAMHAAKRNGRGASAWFESGMLAEIQNRASLLESFHVGLENGEFFVAYEPIIPLAGGKTKFEALFRWRHPHNGVLTAGAFCDVFSDEGACALVGQFVLEEVLGRVAAWRRKGVPFDGVSMNAGLADFRTPQFVDRILAAVATGLIDAEDLCIEVTEDVFLGDERGGARLQIQRLHDAGICVVFDDFGTGYASLLHLRDMPICAVKIDRSFVSEIATEERDRSLVQSVIGLVHALGKRVVAEGVETSEQLAALRGLGCDFVQGHLISRAMEGEEAERFATRRAMADQVGNGR